MNFRTKIEISKDYPKVDYNSNIIFFGSCFAESIGVKIKESQFNINVNPFGIIYNPSSICENIKRVLYHNEYNYNDLSYVNNTWFNYNFHGSFSNVDKNTCLNSINRSVKTLKVDLLNADVLYFTFGTSWVYRLIETSKIVANCHKQPNKIFERFRLSVDEIVDDYTQLLEDIKKINPKVKFVFTVSPVRHWKDGANGNQLSKSILLLAIEKLVKINSSAYYFPSYEIIIDELRDYRFYKDDMLHISDVAVNYIWEQFQYSFFSEKTAQILKQVEKLIKAVNHRTLKPNSNEYLNFIETNLNRLIDIEKANNLSLKGIKNRLNRQNGC